ncbi:transglycosylase domain-containing protein [Salinibacillus xinjiangensis]|uniref:PBP1A family penicillin-binding protein n=1 Tax=Salinibacillus xinjiangensis TaxID=1229268 RepID=A0A6G1XBH1_9BACI|nr:PBP1A family penicillin-binding protein [Salinibacillus xinjiangensis]MRG88282.1 PBP1A family penicillin-binding protein [Salinibacillus xinjiangensis]
MAEQGQSRMQRRQAKKSSNNKKSKINWKKIWIAFAIIGAILFTGVTGTFIYYVSGAPELDAAKLSDPLSSKIYDRDGELIADLGAQKRTKIEYSDIPQVLEDAVIATEDSRFRDHIGIDFRRILAAVWANVTEGFGAQGASTISQQVVKNAFLEFDKTIKRKVQEQWLAIKLEQKYSKNDILTMYLNKIHYGNSTYGVAKAAEVYFGKKNLDDLTLPEAALLAGIPQLPNVYDPLQHPDNAEERKDIVLDLMVQHGKITEKEAAEAKDVKVEDMVVDNYKTNIPYSDFLEHVVKEVQNELGEDVDIYQDGLKIYTTLDTNAQEYVELLLSDSEDNPIKGLYPDDQLETGITVLDTKTGEVLAIGGGRNGKPGLGADFNHAIQGGSQPGSTMKPLIDYGPLIEYQQKSTYYQINDEPYNYSQGNKQEIKNYDLSHTGWQSMRYHIYRSRNVPALKALQEVGLDQAAQFVKGLGIPVPESGIVESDSIGGGHIQVNPFQMAGAFSAFGNGGFYNEPHTVRKIEYRNKVVELKPEPTVAMKDYTAYMITDMLKDVVTSYGTGGNAAVSGLPIAGKTGTTNDDKDSWFTGYTTNFTISVWTGYSQEEKPIEGNGKAIPQSMFRHVMQHISKGVETKDFAKPDSVVEVGVEKGTRPAKLPSEYTPDDEIAYELFVKGHEPEKTSEKYDQIDPIENLQAEYNEKETAVNLSWDHKSENDKIKYEVKAGFENSDLTTITTTDKRKVKVTQIEPGHNYVFEVTAVDSEDPENNRSESVRVKIEVPEEETEPDDLLPGEGENENENPEEDDENSENNDGSPEDEGRNPGENGGEPGDDDENPDNNNGSPEGETPNNNNGGPEDEGEAPDEGGAAGNILERQAG